MKLTIMKLTRFLTIIFIFSIPFYDVPRTFREGIAVSGILMSIIFILFFVEFTINRSKIISFPKELLFSFSPLVIVFILSTLTNIHSFQLVSFNHIILYCYSFVIYTLGTYLIMKNYGITLFSRVLSYSVIVVSIIGFVELMMFYLIGWDAYANFLNHGVHVGLNGGVPRLRSTFNEPSHIAMFLLAVFPLIIYSKNKVAIIIAGIAFIFTLSASAWFGVIGALILTLPILIIKYKRNFLKGTLFVLAIVTPAFYFISPAILGILDKIFNPSQSDSYRYRSWHRAWEAFLDSPILGHGLASYYEYSPMGLFSWYLQLLAEVGILGILALLFFILPVFLWIVKKQDFVTLFFFLAFLLQMAAMNHYYIPGMWILICIHIYEKAYE